MHFVPDFCGMSMEVANQILMEIKRTRRGQSASGPTTSMTNRKFREPQASKPLPSPQPPITSPTGPDQPTQTDRYSYGKEQMSPPPGRHVNQPIPPLRHPLMPPGCPILDPAGFTTNFSHWTTKTFNRSTNSISGCCRSRYEAAATGPCVRT